MALYQLNQGKINGIYYRNNQPILTVTGLYIRIRLLGDAQPFIEAKLEEFIDESGNPFATVAAFITYWNSYFTTLDTGATITIGDVTSNSENIATETTLAALVALFTPQQEVGSVNIYTDGQTIAAGKRRVEIKTDGSFAGTIQGSVVAISSSYVFKAGFVNTLYDIVITCTAGSYTVITSTIDLPG